MTNRLYSSLDEYRGSGYGAAIARQLVRQILLRASVTLPARFDGLSAGGKRILTVGSAMRSHLRQRRLGLTPPDPGGERRLL